MTSVTQAQKGEKLRTEAGEIKRLSLEMSRQRGGYAGQGVALAELAAGLFFHAMRFSASPEVDKPNFHDRFVLSNGHDAIVVYAALCRLGVYSEAELVNGYGAEGSRIEMSPLEQAVPGFEMTAGSLGEGPSQAAGIAYGEKLRGSERRVYCLLSDGELQEGNVWEAAMFAGHHKLDNLILLIDNNNMQATGNTADVLSVEPVVDKFTAFGFEAMHVDGRDVGDVALALDRAANTKGKPIALVVNTRLFHGLGDFETRFASSHFWRVDSEIVDEAIAHLKYVIETEEKSV